MDRPSSVPLPPDPVDAVDLRSDTVTQPPAAMREAIARAPLGDDVYGEDPTVNALEARAADLLGMEAALLTTSGTQANLLALLTHCPRGRKVLVGDQSDAWKFEAGGGSVVGGLVYHPVATARDGTLALESLERAIDPDDPQCAVAGVLCLENSHAMSGGRVLPLEYLAQARAFAERQGVAVHLDGARLFNAAIAAGVAPRAYAATADTVSICLSKGLAAPIGSLLAGRAPVIAEARRLRKLLGGGMRQAGIIAAAGLYAFDHMIGRLADDHATARQLAAALRGHPGLVLDTPAPETNIVYWRHADPAVDAGTFIAALAAEGVRALTLGDGRIRAVTHYGITPADIDRAAAGVRRAVARASAMATSSHRFAGVTP